MPQDITITTVVRAAMFVACLSPCAWLVWTVVNGGLVATSSLGANPIEAINRYLGDWAIRFLLVTLAITPIRHITGWTKIMRFRRMIGLFTFFYVFLHLCSYVGVDQFFNWQEIWLDITQRNYITVGMICFILLMVLAATSTNGMIKKLGGRRWTLLHKLIYLAGVLACCHFFMMRKGIQFEPIAYSAICAVFLGYRIIVAWRKKFNEPHPSLSRNQCQQSEVRQGERHPT